VNHLQIKNAEKLLRLNGRILHDEFAAIVGVQTPWETSTMVAIGQRLMRAAEHLKTELSGKILITVTRDEYHLVTVRVA